MRILTPEIIEQVRKELTPERLKEMTDDKGYQKACSSRDKIFLNFLDEFDNLVLDDSIDNRSVLFYLITTYLEIH